MAAKAVGKLTTGPTLSDQAYLALREHITTGTFTPGMKLTERSLADSLGVSPTPVREALQRLEHERLIERDATRTIRVADPTVARLYELTLIEAALRGVAARLAAERASAAQRSEIARLCDQADAVKISPGVEAHTADLLALTRRFHLLVDQVSHNHTLIDMISTATAFDWTFRLTFSARVHRDAASLHRSLRQHRDVATAIQAGDGARAEQVMREHILQRTAAFLEVAASEGTAIEPTGT
jgi:DNA-binding GntR family transcriptional regulator